MTPIQILIPLTDVLFIIVAMIDICKQVQFKRNDGIIESHNKLKLGQMSICLVGSSFCLFGYGKACGWTQSFDYTVTGVTLKCLKACEDDFIPWWHFDFFLKSLKFEEF